MKVLPMTVNLPIDIDAREVLHGHRQTDGGGFPCTGTPGLDISRADSPGIVTKGMIHRTYSHARGQNGEP